MDGPSSGDRPTRPLPHQNRLPGGLRRQPTARPSHPLRQDDLLPIRRDPLHPVRRRPGRKPGRRCRRNQCRWPTRSPGLRSVHRRQGLWKPPRYSSALRPSSAPMPRPAKPGLRDPGSSRCPSGPHRQRHGRFPKREGPGLPQFHQGPRLLHLGPRNRHNPRREDRQINPRRSRRDRQSSPQDRLPRRDLLCPRHHRSGSPRTRKLPPLPSDRRRQNPDRLLRHGMSTRSSMVSSHPMTILRGPRAAWRFLPGLPYPGSTNRPDPHRKATDLFPRMDRGLPPPGSRKGKNGCQSSSLSSHSSRLPSRPWQPATRQGP
jgi:hypothetical protein